MRIYNSLSRRKEPLVPVDEGRLRVYVCGPTVYDFSHLGHARVFVAFDVIVRYLKTLHPQTCYVRNITDVDDKIIDRAASERESPLDLSQRFTQFFHEDLLALRCLPPDHEPKVSDNIAQIVQMITQLIEQGFAYQAGGDVYFSVEKAPGYGCLSRRQLEDMMAGARVEVAAHKRHPMDFALWKGQKKQEIAWPSPFGPGRPGWHIECSAMNKRYLGDTIDIHGGGRDLMFPHHENENIQSVCANQADFARIWMHAGLVNIHQEKMSKSLGNFFTIRQILEKFDPLAVRFYIFSVHYRSALEFAWEKLQEAQNRIVYFYTTLDKLEKRLPTTPVDPVPGVALPAWAQQIVAQFHRFMQDDFNTPCVAGLWSNAFKLLNEWLDHPDASWSAAQVTQACQQVRDQLMQTDVVCGLLGESPQVVLARITQLKAMDAQVDTAHIERLVAQRNQARSARRFAEADALRKDLESLGVQIHDKQGITSWSLR